MSKTSQHQRLLRRGQPYTRVARDIRYEEVEFEVDGEMKKGLRAEECYALKGYTLEEKLQPDKGDDPEWKLEWEEHDLGQHPTVDEAFAKGVEWRSSLVGVYEIR